MLKLSQLNLASLIGAGLISWTPIYAHSEINALHTLAREALVNSLLASENPTPNDLNCAIAYKVKRIKLDKELIKLAKIIREKCAVLESFDQKVLPILKKGKVTATISEDIDVGKPLKLSRIKFTDIGGAPSAKLEHCRMNISLFTQDSGDIDAVAHDIQCKESRYAVSYQLSSFANLKSYVTCVKYVEGIPAIFQPCKQRILSKNTIITFSLSNPQLTRLIRE